MKCMSLILAFVSIIFVNSISKANLSVGVYRDLPDQPVMTGQEFSIDIIVITPPQGAYYAIEEFFPPSFTLSDPGDFYYTPTNPNRLPLVEINDVHGPITHTYSLIAPDIPGEYFWNLNANYCIGWAPYDPDDHVCGPLGGDIQLNVIPEPTTLVLLSLGGLALLKRRRAL